MFWTTGGGFSNAPSAPRPWYQDAAVKQYLATAPAADMPLPSMFNATNRAYPDVSAIGHNLMCVVRNFTQPVDGTSAATPIFAGLLSHLNAARMAKGMPAIGFSNPLLYQAHASHSSIFYDIASGNNRCGVFTCCPYGFQAVEGYDATSGLGSVGDFAKLKAFALKAAAVALLGAPRVVDVLDRQVGGVRVARRLPLLVQLGEGRLLVQRHLERARVRAGLRLRLRLLRAHHAASMASRRATSNSSTTPWSRRSRISPCTKR